MPNVYGMDVKARSDHAGNMKNFCMIFRQGWVEIDIVFSLLPLRVYKLDCTDQIISVHIFSFSN